VSADRPLPDKLFFRIGEVAEIVGVKPHVLRYWESEFGCLRPMKTRGAHRQYRRRDVELALIIKQLVHEEGYTIPGARRRLRELGHDRSSAPLPDEPGREVQLRAALLGVRAELVSILETLDRMSAPPREVVREEMKVSANVPVSARPRPPAP
jgi:DNA-binding transcriptional MerR regulator